MEQPAAQNTSFRHLLGLRNFRLLWGAGALSAIGDQFDLIAFPWLVLLVTGDPLAVGAVLAVSGIPTVFFMLLGGSLVDRFSPLPIMQVSNVTRVGLSLSLAALILAGQVELWLIYPFALVKGIADAFYYPSQGAILPRIVSTGQLRQSNAVLHTTAELSGLVGPTMAGALIAFFSAGAGRPLSAVPGLSGLELPGGALTGIGLAFALVGLAFVVSALLLAWMRLGDQQAEAARRTDDGGGILRSIGAGIRFVRADTAMFTMFLLIAGVELLVEGPVIVGIPILADTQLAEGALAVGVISSSYAGGALLGSILAGTLPAPKRGLGPIFLALLALTGLLLMPFGFLRAMWMAAAVALIIGVGGGYTDIMFTSWLQARTPRWVMGRVMSLLMVAAIGLSPLSTAASGALIKLSLRWVFLGAGALLTLLCLTAALSREVRSIAMPDSAGPPAPE